MDIIQKNLLAQVADLHEVPEGAYNIRANGAGVSRNTTANIDIVTKSDKDGIDIIIKPGTKNESVHIPVLLSKSGMQEVVYNDFYIGKNATAERARVLVADNVIQELSTLTHQADEIALVCYELPNEFCHRHLIAQWLKQYGYDVEEYL